MRRLWLLAGMMVLLPLSRAHAQAVSPAVTAILSRTDAALGGLDSDPLFTFVAQQLPGWSQDVLSQVLESVDTRTQVIVKADDLRNRTTCFQADIFLLERKMEQVRGKMNDALTARDIPAITGLTQILAFLQRQTQLVLQGGEHPSVTDTAWKQKQDFEKTAPSDQRDMCYFSSDYLPPTQAGYGCDVETLDRVLSTLPGDAVTLRTVAQKERDALQKVQDAVSQYALSAQTMQQLGATADALARGVAPPDPATARPPAREHKSQQGCVTGLEPGQVFQALRSPFSVTPDDLDLLLAFRNARKQEEDLRPYSKQIAFNDVEDWMDGLRQTAQTEYHAFTVKQAGDEADTFAIAADGERQVEDALSGLQEGIGKLALLGSAKDGGLRSFVRDFGYYLLRTCQGRPGDERLKRVLAIAFSDACFPYVSGDYLLDTETSPRWKACTQQMQQQF